MFDDEDHFSKREGFAPDEPPPTIREDAPEGLRNVMLNTAVKIGIRPLTLRELVCKVLTKRPDPGNWSEYPNVWSEVQDLVYDCKWYKVYDIAEEIAGFLRDNPRYAHSDRKRFSDEMNAVFRELGIAWQMDGGRIVSRGADALEATLAEAKEQLGMKGLHTAHGELEEAIRDMSRRPDPDLSGAIQHAMAALECVAREVSEDPKKTFGDLLKKHTGLLPKPLDEALHKIWGYSSNVARHGSENRELNFAESQLVVGLAVVIAQYIITKNK